MCPDGDWHLTLEVEVLTLPGKVDGNQNRQAIITHHCRASSEALLLLVIMSTDAVCVYTPRMVDEHTHTLPKEFMKILPFLPHTFWEIQGLMHLNLPAGFFGFVRCGSVRPSCDPPIKELMSICRDMFKDVYLPTY